MLHVFVDPAQIGKEEVRITGADVNHIRNVMRLREGDALSVSDGVSDRDILCEIADFPEGEVLCRIREIRTVSRELPARVILFQGLPKGEKMELIIQKAVELGVSEIVPVSMRRCVVRLDEKKRAKKTARWQTIAESAAKQCRRTVVPLVHEPVTMAEALTLAQSSQVRLLPYELQEDDGSTKELFRSLPRDISLSVFIGPEGGFDPAEVEAAREAGVRPVSLGRRILRTETAPLVVLSWLILHYEIG